MLILRPQSFPNYAGAINYYIYSGLINNLDSACLSVPSLVRLNEETSKYEWVTDLLSSRAYWESWYKDMSKKFISLSVPRLLVLAGKFQLSIFKGCGHILHEDSPLEFADVLYTFANRNKALDPEFILALKAKYTKQ
ncbi:putative protein phosphatase methylesterase 1 [Zancudomyces culisetae]|uniref:Uncharacterized protein n=1 Tax=Zancudomyces culisetae TaxID=1213189 RepID=A0A1R1PCW1_ZANCU|nr:putative protein phosphatase methylesterase 1 [Zancudomyces culisetae]|eukprot:OMH78806.1 putative protein phosphatase methylesterase 1 [Zancudomyces culisetae]